MRWEEGIRLQPGTRIFQGHGKYRSHGVVTKVNRKTVTIKWERFERPARLTYFELGNIELYEEGRDGA